MIPLLIIQGGRGLNPAEFETDWNTRKNFEHIKDHATSGVDCFTKRSFQLGKDMVFQAMPDQWNSIPQQELQTIDSEKQLHS